MTRVKICGITNIEDAMAAVEAGADALGFVFAESPRKVDPETVGNIIAELPPFITTVGVFANQKLEEILSVMQTTALRFAQLHGSLSFRPDELHRWGTIMGIRVGDERDIALAADDPSVRACSAVLLDAHVEGMMGGTGRTFDWNLAIQAKSLKKPIILAGGLTPANVEEAVQKVCPYAVDVSTGVEASPGRKDHSKIEEFIHNAKKHD